MTPPERHPKNAPGPFYVVRGDCIACGAPEVEAPAVMGPCGDADGCYFRKQPDTPDETNQAIRAVLVSCVNAHRYGGRDPEILRRLAELGLSDQCDHPAQGHAKRMRNYASFAAVANDARALSRKLLASFEQRWRRPELGWRDAGEYNEVGGTKEAAFFEVSHAKEDAPPRHFELQRLEAGRWLLWCPPCIGYLLAIHDVLEASGATEIRWFSLDEWELRAQGRPLPY